MKAPLVATLICLYGAANAATCSPGTLNSQAGAARPGDGLILAAAARLAPDPGTQAQASTDTETPHNERDLLLAGLALMAAIALRRTGTMQ